MAAPRRTPRETVFAKCTCIGGDVWSIVVGIDIFPAQDNEYGDHRYFEKYNDAVEDGAAFCSANQEDAHQHYDQERRDIDDSPIPWAGGQGLRQMYIESFKKDDEISAPTDTDGSGCYGIFENEIPADDPGYQFAHGGV